MPQDLADPGAYAFLISAMGHKKHDWETAAAGARGPSPVKGVNGSLKGTVFRCRRCEVRLRVPLGVAKPRRAHLVAAGVRSCPEEVVEALMRC